MNILKILLDAGCREEEKNNDGLTYMNYARDKGYIHAEDIDKLLEEMMESNTPK
ncbi:MAG: hypothetical protein KDD45_11420 [Bdellovibrionales bacterium]|nr:hypothetical protein [Bdellovibrionales bacterium]